MGKEVYFLRGVNKAERDILSLIPGPNPHRLSVSSRSAIPSSEEIYAITKATKGILYFPPGGFPDVVNTFNGRQFNISFLDHFSYSVVLLDEHIDTLVYHKDSQKLGNSKCVKVVLSGRAIEKVSIYPKEKRPWLWFRLAS